MKILMLVNWKVEYCNERPLNRQSPDYFVKNTPYWFFRYFKNKHEVDVIDISSYSWIENFEREKIRFYVIQAVKALPKLNKYDLIISHGMQSGIVVSLYRKLIKTKAKHLVFDIGAFNSASETGRALEFMQFASSSIDRIIYHTSNQIEYYKKCFPWLVQKSKFIKFGTDFDDLMTQKKNSKVTVNKPYIICVGWSKRDWDTLVDAYRELDTDIKLKLVGRVEEKFTGISNILQIPYIPFNELVDEILGAQFCILPLKSYNYSFGQMTLLQQMALGKCVIAAKVPSLIDYAIDGENVIFYESQDSSDLKSKIEYMLKNPKEREIIGKNAEEYVKSHCNEEEMAQEIEKTIDQMFENKKTGR